MTAARTELPDGPIFVPEDCHETMPAPECVSFLSIVDDSLNPIRVRDLEQVVLNDLMAENRGLTIYDLMKRSSECPSVTMTSDESYNGVETCCSLPFYGRHGRK